VFGRFNHCLSVIARREKKERDQESSQLVLPRRLTLIRTHFWRRDKSVGGEHHHPKTDVVVPVVVRVVVVPRSDAGVLMIVVPRPAPQRNLWLVPYIWLIHAPNRRPISVVNLETCSYLRTERHSRSRASRIHTRSCSRCRSA